MSKSDHNMCPADGRSRQRWLLAGWILTAGWILFVLLVSGGDTARPLFDAIFLVPLAGWLLGLLIARLRKRGRR